MPSPFPGMDPFIESQVWEDFHTTAITVIRELLTPRLGDRYTAHVERRIYIERDPPNDERDRHIKADMAVVHEANPSIPEMIAIDTNVTTTIECLLPEPTQHREAFLTIRDPDESGVVTVLELLSPSNKRRGSDGRREYLKKREEVIESNSHLIEIDLLRDGERMPMQPSSPAIGEYVALISRSNRRPWAELVAWPLPQELPTISIPLAPGDPDIHLDLQAVLDAVYDRANYRRMIKYSIPLLSPPDNQTQHWITQQLAAKHTSPESPQ